MATLLNQNSARPRNPANLILTKADLAKLQEKKTTALKVNIIVINNLKGKSRKKCKVIQFQSVSLRENHNLVKYYHEEQMVYSFNEPKQTT